MRHVLLSALLLLSAPLRADEQGAAAGARGPLVSDEIPGCLRDGSCTAFRFRRPEDCSEKRRKLHGRKARVCKAERWRTVYVGSAGQVVHVTSPGPPKPLLARDGRPGRFELWELQEQWQRCAPEDDPRLQGDPAVLQRHPDPDLGVCTLLRLPDASGPDAPAAADLRSEWRADRLDALHPYVAEAARELMRRMAAAGHPVRIISGYRAYRGRGGRRTSWHAWGVSFDVNLVSRGSMADAKKHYDEDREAWALVESTCRDLALWWGGVWGLDEIFHIEWHPGYGGRLTDAQLRDFLELAGDDGADYKKTWVLFEGK